MSEQCVGSIAFCRVESFADPRPFCEAPRHAGQGIPSHYVMAFVGEGPEDGENVVQAMCCRCALAITDHLGVPISELLIA